MLPDVAHLHLEDGVQDPVQLTAYNPSRPAFYSGHPRARDITKEFNHASAGMSILLSFFYYMCYVCYTRGYCSPLFEKKKILKTSYTAKDVAASSRNCA